MLTNKEKYSNTIIESNKIMEPNKSIESESTVSNIGFLWSVIKNTFISPSLAYKSILNAKSIYHFGAAYSVVLVLFLIVFFVKSDALMKNELLSFFDMSVLMFFIPILFAVPIMHIHLTATTMGAKGSFFDFYKLILWSFIPFFVYYMVLFFVAIAVTMVTNYVFSFYFYLITYLSVIVFYFSLSLSVSTNISKKRSLFIYLFCGAVFYVFIKLLTKQ